MSAQGQERWAGSNVIETAGSSESARRPGPRSNLALQGLRAAAAFLVVLDHSLLAAVEAGLAGPQFTAPALILGMLGVHVFFVISGVVMMLGHGDDFGRPGAGRRFAARRVSRIVPLYWLTTFVVATFRPETAGPAELVQSLLFIPHQMTGGPYGWPVYALGWTLQYEMFFYLLFALALGFTRRLGLRLLAGTILALAAAAAAGMLRSGTIAGYYGNPVILYFLAGIGIGLAAPGLAARSHRRPGFGTALALASAALAAACAIAWIAGLQSRLAIAAMAGAAVLAVAVCTSHGPSAPDKPSRKLADALGDATYSIYLTHAFVAFGIGRLIARSGVDVPLILFLPTAVAASAVVGIATYRWLERPLVTTLGRWLGQRPGIGGRPV